MKTDRKCQLTGGPRMLGRAWKLEAVRSKFPGFPAEKMTELPCFQKDEVIPRGFLSLLPDDVIYLCGESVDHFSRPFCERAFPKMEKDLLGGVQFHYTTVIFPSIPG